MGNVLHECSVKSIKLHSDAYVTAGSFIGSCSVSAKNLIYYYVKIEDVSKMTK